MTGLKFKVRYVPNLPKDLSFTSRIIWWGLNKFESKGARCPVCKMPLYGTVYGVAIGFVDLLEWTQQPFGGDTWMTMGGFGKCACVKESDL